MRSAVSQANKTFDNSTNAAAGFGANAGTIGANLTPMLMQRLNNPQGYSPGDMTAMLSAALGSQGGSTSAITGEAAQKAAATRNDAGFSSALTEAQRLRAKNLAQTSEGIAADNAGLKQDQSKEAAKMLAGLYGTDVQAQEGFTGQANQATQNAIEGSKTGWMQNLTQLLAAINGGGAGAAAITKYCWIAAELYGGWTDPRTIAVRNWLSSEFSSRRYGTLVLHLYSRYGEAVAAMIRKHPSMRRPFKALFDKALRKATGVS